MIDISLELIALLTLAAFLAGFVDSIAGGGGLIAVPALLLAGFSPVETVATNKVGSTFGSSSATWAYASRGLIDLRAQAGPALIAGVGGAAGAVLATAVPGEWMRALLPVLLIAVALYFAVKPGMNDMDRAQRMTPLLFALTVVPAIGLYDGVFGPGTGSFFMLALVGLRGYGVLKATAHTKLLNWGSNVGSLLVFALSGAIIWKVGLAMGVGQFLGARIGAAVAMKVGSRLIKPLLVVVCLALAARLLTDPANPLHTMIFG